MILWSCGTKPLPNQSDTLTTTVSSVAGVTDSTFSLPCIWIEEAYKIDTDHPRALLRALQEMRTDFADCYLRHNGNLP